jgi:ADP-ribosyl-[dinitrogen reductase] hydrolase
MEGFSEPDDSVYQIQEFPTGTRGGTIGVAGAPGRCDGPHSGYWVRALWQDLVSARLWGARYLVNLLEPDEMRARGIGELEELSEDLQFDYYALPIARCQVPGSTFLDRWRTAQMELSSALFHGHQMLIVSASGNGRACTVACMLLLASNTVTGASHAIARIRSRIPQYAPDDQTRDFLRMISSPRKKESGSETTSMPCDQRYDADAEEFEAASAAAEESNTPRTSQSGPLQIATVLIRAGAIGITSAPGEQRVAAMKGLSSGDLETDLQAISDWGATHVISLVERFELTEQRIEHLSAQVEIFGMRWIGMRIVKGHAPGPEFIQQWLMIEPALTIEIARGARVLIHSNGGLGRAGTVAAMLLLSMHETDSASQAMEMVRQVRPGAIETGEQEEFLAGWPALRRSPGPRQDRYIGLDEPLGSKTCLKLVDVEFDASRFNLVCEAVDLDDVPPRRGALIQEDNLMYHPEGRLGHSISGVGMFLLEIAKNESLDMHMRQRATLYLEQFPTFDDMERMWRFNRPPKGVAFPIEGRPENVDKWQQRTGQQLLKSARVLSCKQARSWLSSHSIAPCR